MLIHTSTNNRSPDVATWYFAPTSPRSSHLAHIAVFLSWRGSHPGREVSSLQSQHIETDDHWPQILESPIDLTCLQTLGGSRSTRANPHTHWVNVSDDWLLMLISSPQTCFNWNRGAEKTSHWSGIPQWQIPSLFKSDTCIWIELMIRHVALAHAAHERSTVDFPQDDGTECWREWLLAELVMEVHFSFKSFSALCVLKDLRV